VNSPEVIFGRVAKMERMMEATLKITKIRVGINKCLLETESSLGMILANAREIMIAFTESRIFAFVSAISLNFMWFLRVTLKRD
jgi:hypothetical protein